MKTITDLKSSCCFGQVNINTSVTTHMKYTTPWLIYTWANTDNEKIPFIRIFILHTNSKGTDGINYFVYASN